MGKSPNSNSLRERYKFLMNPQGLDCLWIQIIPIPEWHILGMPILNHFVMQGVDTAVGWVKGTWDPPPHAFLGNFLWSFHILKFKGKRKKKKTTFGLKREAGGSLCNQKDFGSALGTWFVMHQGVSLYSDMVSPTDQETLATVTTQSA